MFKEFLVSSHTVNKAVGGDFYDSVGNRVNYFVVVRGKKYITFEILHTVVYRSYRLKVEVVCGLVYHKKI